MATQAKLAPPFVLDRTISIRWSTILLSVVTILRFALIAVPSHGYDSFAYKHWTWRLVHEPLSTIYVDDGQALPDHLPGDLWLFKLMGEGARFVDPGFNFYGPTYGVMISLLAIAFDALLAVSIVMIGRSLGKQQAGRIAATIYWCAPAPIFVASVWGQIDAISSALAVVALGLAINKRFSLAFVALTLCALVKPQFAMLAMPLLIGWWKEEGDDPRRFVSRMTLTGAGCLAMLAAIIAPFSVSPLGGWGDWSMIERVHIASEKYPVTSLGAHNIWILGPEFDWPTADTSVILFGITSQQIGFVLFGFVAAFAMWLLICRWRGAITMVLASNVLVLGFFLFSTRMHERYLFPAVGLSILLMVMDWRYRWFAAIMGTVVVINIAGRFAWPLYDSWNGWRSLVTLQWLEHAWFVQLMVAITVVAFLGLSIEGTRRKSP